MAYEVPVTQARAEFADLVNRVVYGGERVVLTRHGKPIAALVSAADLERLDQEPAAEQETVIRLSSEAPGLVEQPVRRPMDIAARARPEVAAKHQPRGGNNPAARQ
jgi:prevent-host-death family protein